MPIFNRLERVFGKLKNKEEIREVLKRREGDKVRSLLEGTYRKKWAQNIEDFLKMPFAAYK